MVAVLADPIPARRSLPTLTLVPAGATSPTRPVPHRRTPPATHRPAVRTHPAAVYRRRRLVALVLLALAVVAGWAGASRAVATLGGDPASAPGRGAPAVEVSPLAARSVVVRSGDTLWSIARRLQPSGDLRDLVTQLVRAHGGTALQPGEVVSLP